MHRKRRRTDGTGPKGNRRVQNRRCEQPGKGVGICRSTNPFTMQLCPIFWQWEVLETKDIRSSGQPRQLTADRLSSLCVSHARVQSNGKWKSMSGDKPAMSTANPSGQTGSFLKQVQLHQWSVGSRAGCRVLCVNLQGGNPLSPCWILQYSSKFNCLWRIWWWYSKKGACGGTARKGHPEGLVRDESLAGVGLYWFSALLTSGNPLQNHQTGFTQTLSTMGNTAQIASPWVATSMRSGVTIWLWDGF